MAGVIGERDGLVAGDGIQPPARRFDVVSFEKTAVPLAATYPGSIVACHAGLDDVSQCLRRYREGEVALKKLLEPAPDRMRVGLDDAGHGHFPLQVHDLGLRAAQGQQVDVLAQGQDVAILDGNRFHPGLLGVFGINAAIVEQHVGIVA